MKRWLPWLALVVVLVVGLIAGTAGRHGDTSVDGRVQHITSEIRCPTCSGQSANDSDSAASQAIRDEVRRRVTAGQSDGEIRAFLVSRYGKDILLRPDAHGISALVWELPVAGFVLAVAGLVVAFRRWRVRTGVTVTPEDRALVEQALS
jgi:cytochrome c-type biogenesis protein CcmH